jgi:hypothetical protein
MRLKIIFVVLLVMFFSATTALAVPTHITVRVKTKDAKFLGTSMGGALVTIKNAGTGELLAKGITEGATGNTNTIMINPHVRGVPISDERSAKFTATIDINEPTQIEVAAQGPLSVPHSVNTVMITQWVVPGKHINRGDALMLELPGLMVKLLSPLQGKTYNKADNVEIQTTVRMM